MEKTVLLVTGTLSFLASTVFRGLLGCLANLVGHVPGLGARMSKPCRGFWVTLTEGLAHMEVDMPTDSTDLWAFTSVMDEELSTHIILLPMALEESVTPVTSTLVSLVRPASRRSTKALATPAGKGTGP